MSSLINQISELVEKEVRSAVDKKLTKHLEYISKKWNISLKILLQDSIKIEDNQIEVEDSCSEESSFKGQCLGIKGTDHKRCTFAGKYGGYCKRHRDQKKIERPTIQLSPKSAPVVIEHTHTFQECLFKPGCPACEKSKRVPSSENLLIDL